ncbi:hypothetical protein CON64_14965 [Bacillus pseudomycoides]|nr:hypothetical protein CON64_14965 [Bacillus pseudomycoides]
MICFGFEMVQQICNIYDVKIEIINVDERDTTKTCCVCGHKEKKAPSIRVFICVSCKTTLMSDNNASVNIAKKQFFLQDTYFSKLSTFTHAGYVPVRQKCVITNFFFLLLEYSKRNCCPYLYMILG